MGINGIDNRFTTVAEAADFAYMSKSAVRKLLAERRSAVRRLNALRSEEDEQEDIEGDVLRTQVCNQFSVYAEFQTYGGVGKNTFSQAVEAIKQSYAQFLNGQGFFFTMVSTKLTN